MQFMLSIVEFHAKIVFIVMVMLITFAKVQIILETTSEKAIFRLRHRTGRVQKPCGYPGFGTKQLMMEDNLNNRDNLSHITLFLGAVTPEMVVLD